MLQKNHRFYGVTQIPTSNRLLRRPEVELKTGLSRASLYVAISAGTFPEPISIGPNRVAWLEVEIDQWINERLAARDSAKQ
jgi:prophage regulatory protein